MEKLHYLTFVSHPKLEDLEFLSDDIEYKARHVENGDGGQNAVTTLLAFANLASKSSISKIKEILKINRNLSSIEEYTDAVYSSMVPQFGPIISDTIMLTIKNDGESNTISDVENLFLDTAEAAFHMAQTWCMSISTDINESYDGSRLAMIINAIENTFPPEIRYRPTPAFNKITGKIVYCDGYSVNSASDALYLCFILCVKEKYDIRQCKMCGNYFMPVKKSNEIYCKNCRTKTYDTKVKNDEVARAYRTIYKTQNARKQRNLHRPNIEQKFDKWKTYSKIKLQQCQDHKITIEEMKAAISSDEWINGGFPD